MNEKTRNYLIFIWRTASIHTIAYFIAGIFALLFMNYKVHFSSEIMAVVMRPLESPWVALGPGLQIFRGLIIGLVLYPFREGFLLTKKGWLKLWALIIGLSYFSTIGPTFGSFEGYVYTNVSLPYHLLGIPETLLYSVLFSFFIFGWYKKPSRVWNILSVVFVVLIVVMSLAGFVSRIQ